MLLAIILKVQGNTSLSGYYWAKAVISRSACESTASESVTGNHSVHSYPSISSTASGSVLPSLPIGTNDSSLTSRFRSTTNTWYPHPEATPSRMPVYFVSLRLCFSEAKFQTKIIKGVDIEVDRVVIRKIRMMYVNALNPLRRWIPKPTLFKWAKTNVDWVRAMSNKYERFEGKLWTCVYPMARRLSLWDLKAVHEAQVTYS